MKAFIKKYLIIFLCTILLFSLYMWGNNIEQVNTTNDEEVNNITEHQDNDSTSYDKIANYLEKQAENTFSEYYQLLSFNIDNYEENVQSNNVEAILNYEITYKNYDIDPDTVDYIRISKENNSPYYKTYYEEYLESKDMYMEIKVKIDKEGAITLWADNDPTENREWVSFEMSDCIIGK